MKQLGELHVVDYMTCQAVVINDSDKLTHAVGLMDREHLSMLPVVDEQGRVVGILTNTDLVEITHEIQSDLGVLAYVSDTTRQFLIKNLMETGKDTFVRDVMTTPVDTVPASENLVVAAKKLVNRKYHHLPVVDESGKPVGVLSTTDFVRAVADYGALLAG